MAEEHEEAERGAVKYNKGLEWRGREKGNVG